MVAARKEVQWYMWQRKNVALVVHRCRGGGDRVVGYEIKEREIAG